MNTRGLAAAWLVGEALIIWRIVHREHHLPAPGVLLGVSALFAGLAVAADVFPQAEQVIVLSAFGLDIAALFNLWPAGLGGQVTRAASTGSGDQINQGG